MLETYRLGLAKGFTTNPALMKAAGVTDYKAFAKTVLAHITDLPVSFEVIADDFPTMEKEAIALAALGKNVYVKIPIMNTSGESTLPLIRKLSLQGYQLNVTAIFTLYQVKSVVKVLNPEVSSFVSVFAGYIADTGVNASVIMKEAAKICKSNPGVELLWASCRELYNIIEADQCECAIITVPNRILGKIATLEKNLHQYSLDTIKGFYQDAKGSGCTIL